MPPPAIGPITLAYEDLDRPTQPEQTILVFTAEPGTASEEPPREAHRDRGRRVAPEASKRQRAQAGVRKSADATTAGG